MASQNFAYFFVAPIIISVSPLVLPPVTSANKVNLMPSLADSELLLSTSKTVTRDNTVTQRIVTEPVTSSEGTTDKLTTLSNVKISSSNLSSLTKEWNLPTKPQKHAKEKKRSRSRKHSKGANQRSRNMSQSAAQNLIQTIARMYASRSTTSEILAKFQVRMR